MAAAPELADAMVNAKTTGALPTKQCVAKKATYHFWFQLEVAGRMAVQIGAFLD